MEDRGQRLPDMTKCDTWKSKFPMQRLQPGLKALLSFPSDEQDLQRPHFRFLTRANTISFSSQFLSPPSSPSSEMGMKSPSDDREKEKQIGEQEIDEEEEEEEEEVVECMSRRQKWGKEWRKREFPPPLPTIVKTEKNSARPVHMPRSLKKYSYSTDNGVDERDRNRIVIVAERMTHHEYFRVQRANGHLILTLVCIDEDEKNLEEDHMRRHETDDIGVGGESSDVEQEYCETDETEEIDDTEEKEYADRTVEDVAGTTLASSMPELVSKSNGECPSGKCWMISSSVGGAPSSDLFRPPIPVMRPIHG